MLIMLLRLLVGTDVLQLAVERQFLTMFLLAPSCGLLYDENVILESSSNCCHEHILFAIQADQSYIHSVQILSLFLHVQMQPDMKQKWHAAAAGADYCRSWLLPYRWHLLAAVWSEAEGILSRGLQGCCCDGSFSGGSLKQSSAGLLH